MNTLENPHFKRKHEIYRVYITFLNLAQNHTEEYQPSLPTCYIPGMQTIHITMGYTVTNSPEKRTETQKHLLTSHILSGNLEMSAVSECLSCFQRLGNYKMAEEQTCHLKMKKKIIRILPKAMSRLGRNMCQ